MDHVAAASQAALQQQAQERMKRKLDEVNSTIQAQLHPVTDHINFTLQQAYFKCAYECFDRKRKQEEIASCIENCSVPERMRRSFMVCQDKYEAAMLQTAGPDAMNTLESCVDGAVKDNASLIPHIVRKLKTSI
ncbi:unnamed protein product [Linum tenue]|uniref:Protein FAM136A n=1 Tax=Linum tenue TaxID=586396 RepID=A0AAV0LPB1_9ROSI|nr:unnamed protein product [Linum tenue]